MSLCAENAGGGWYKRVGQSTFFERNYGVLQWRSDGNLSLSIRDSSGRERLVWRPQRCQPFDPAEEQRQADTATAVLWSAVAGVITLSVLWHRRRSL